MERRQNAEPNQQIWGLLGGHDGQRPIVEFGQDAEVTPLEGHPGILMTTVSQDLGIILIMPDSLSWKRPIIKNINNILGYINKYTEIINVRKHKTGEELIYPLSDKSIYTQYKCTTI